MNYYLRVQYQVTQKIIIIVAKLRESRRPTNGQHKRKLRRCFSTRVPIKSSQFSKSATTCLFNSNTGPWRIQSTSSISSAPTSWISGWSISRTAAGRIPSRSVSSTGWILSSCAGTGAAAAAAAASRGCQRGAVNCKRCAVRLVQWSQGARLLRLLVLRLAVRTDRLCARL